MCVNFEHFLPFYSVFTIDFEQVNVSCDERFGLKVRAEWFIEEQIFPATFYFLNNNNNRNKCNRSTV